MKAINTTLALALGVSLLLAASVFIGLQTYNAEGSAIMGQEYSATSSFAAYPDNTRTLKRGYGSLGSFVITGDNTGTVSFYNATTANASLRAASKATSSILIADFPASSPEGTYTFDIAVTDGLLMVTTGAEATGTVTFR